MNPELRLVDRLFTGEDKSKKPIRPSFTNVTPNKENTIQEENSDSDSFMEPDLIEQEEQNKGKNTSKPKQKKSSAKMRET